MIVLTTDVTLTFIATGLTQRGLGDYVVNVLPKNVALAVLLYRSSGRIGPGIIVIVRILHLLNMIVAIPFLMV